MDIQLLGSRRRGEGLRKKGRNGVRHGRKREEQIRMYQITACMHYLIRIYWPKHVLH